MSTPSRTSDPGHHPELLVPISDDATLQGYLSSAPSLLPWMIVILRRPPPAKQDAPRPETPRPRYHELDDDLFLGDANPMIYPHSDSDDDDDSVRKRFTPPRTVNGFLKTINKVSRSISRQMELSKQLQASAAKKIAGGEVMLPSRTVF
jgi:hypothetical protein